MLPPPPRSPLFPYTTLFRSQIPQEHVVGRTVGVVCHQIARLAPKRHVPAVRADCGSRRNAISRARSEEHTSELQSPCNLVCRLLLEKKKRITKTMATKQQHT